MIRVREEPPLRKMAESENMFQRGHRRLDGKAVLSSGDVRRDFSKQMNAEKIKKKPKAD